MKLEKKDLIITVLILIILVLSFSCGYFIFRNYGNKGENSNSQINTNTDDINNQESDLTWTNYILNQNISKIELSNYSNDQEITKNLTVEQLRDFFEEITNNTRLVLMYSTGGGFSGGNKLKVYYIKNSKEYYFSILPYSELSGTTDSNIRLVDKDLELALNNSVIYKNEEEKDDNFSYPCYFLTKQIDVLEDYFK